MQTFYAVKYDENGKIIKFLAQETQDLPVGYDVVLSRIQFNEYVSQNPPQQIITEDIEIDQDILFGHTLIREFLIDNRKDPNVSSELSLLLLQKFMSVESLARLGDIRKVRVLLGAMEVDTIFTQERKDRYLSMINLHLAKYG